METGSLNNMTQTFLLMNKQLNVLVKLLSFHPREAFVEMRKKIKVYFPLAWVFIVFTPALIFIKGFNSSSVVSYVLAVGSPFLVAAIVQAAGKGWFKGKGDFWQIFVTLAYVNVVSIILLPGFFMGSFVLLSLAVVVLIISLIYRILAISVVHKIGAGESFVLLLVSGAVIYLLGVVVAALTATSGALAGMGIHFVA
jgi:uncharacterized membrane protein HdeD (DUF308 family)